MAKFRHIPTARSLRRAPGAPGIVRPAVRRHVGHNPLQPTDPRWVLAVQVHRCLQGCLLGIDDRRRLLRLGRLLGLSPFDSNLVVAIVQDRARRGQGLADAAAALVWVGCAPSPTRPPRRVRLGWIAAVLVVIVFEWWWIIHLVSAKP